MSENVAIVLQILLPKKKERPVENSRFFYIAKFFRIKGRIKESLSKIIFLPSENQVKTDVVKIGKGDKRLKIRVRRVRFVACIIHPGNVQFVSHLLLSKPHRLPQGF